MNPEQIDKGVEDRCWVSIGIGGNRSCPELEAVIHCRNCPVFASAARTLLDRATPPGYLAERTEMVAQAQTRETAPDCSVVLFRLGEEWLALDTAHVLEVIADRPISRVAHRSGGPLLGIVNVNGQIRLCVGSHALFEVNARSVERALSRRMLVIRKDADVWVLTADEVFNVHRFRKRELETPPLTVAAGEKSHVRGVFSWGERKVGYLAGDEIFSTLRRLVG